MILKPQTIRGQLSLMIAIMGGIGLTCSIFIVNLFVDQILYDQRVSTLELVKQETITQTEKHIELLQELGLRIQKKPEFRKAIRNKDLQQIKILLNDEFFQYYITAKILNVNKIYAFNKNFQLLEQSTEGEDFSATKQLCPQLPTQAKKRTGASRLKTINSFCFYNEHALHSIIVPIGTLSPIGYLQLVSNPANFFQTMETKLSMPLQIKSSIGKVSYQSNQWITSTSKGYLTIDHAIADIESNPAIDILMQKDISATRKSFSRSRTLIIIIVSCITIIAVFLFLFIFEKSMLKPLNRLAKQFTIIKTNKDNFGDQLKLEGGPEIISLTENFNGLSSQLAKMYQKLELLAFTDQLTALPNRSRLHEILDFHTTENQRNNTPFTLFMMDLDRFKSVNDTLGHHAGDLLLQQVSDRLKHLLRKSDYISIVSELDVELFQSDVLARLGGDEFAVVLPAMGNEDDAINIAQKVLLAMKKPFFIDKIDFNVGVSIGIAICPIHAANSEHLMQYADVAMYQAKENQKGYSVFSSKQDSKNRKLRALDTDLRKAISENSLNLAYQPKIDLRTNKIVGVEALLRWTHNEHGFIPPDHFIPIAEQSSLINEVTDWVLNTALLQKSQWKEQGIELTMAINLSAKNLLDENLIPNVKKQLEKYNVAPESIYLELTETAVMSDPSHAIIVMRQLYDMGVRISIDDFGTGYSSLSYLKQLPVDEIKIDRSFVMDMEHDGNDAIIVQSTIDLAHNMGLRVIAEGVENSVILNELSNRTCDLAQGYYMAKPMTNNELIDWLKNSPWGLNTTVKKAV